MRICCVCVPSLVAALAASRALTLLLPLMLLAHIGQLFDKTEAQSVGIKREVGNPPQPTILATLPSPFLRLRSTTPFARNSTCVMGAPASIFDTKVLAKVR